MLKSLLPIGILIITLSIILISGHITNVFAPPPPIPLAQAYKLQIGDQNYDILYNTTSGVQVKTMYADPSADALLVVLDSTSDNGRFTIDLPRQIIDSKNSANALGCYITSSNNTKIYVPCGDDRPYDVTISDYPDKSDLKHVIPIYESFTPEVRVLTIDQYPKGTSIIAITGTYIVPEFDSLAELVMAVAVAGAVGIGIISARSMMLKK